MSAILPVVSVCCITYNHEAYLAQAIESVLTQETDFAVELVIGEDCSTDSTRALAQDYAQRFPGRVRVLAHPHNLGIMPNLMATLAACSGEFVAFLEGDDYWVDTLKLQMQVDALRASPDCAMCFHDAETFRDGVAGELWTFSEKYSHILPGAGAGSRRYTHMDLAQLGWFMPSAAMVFRANSLPRPLPAWFAGVFSGDYTLQLLSTRNGDALYLPRIMSRYRLHQQSITSSTGYTVYQFERRIFEAKMFQQHVFGPGDQKFANIYLSKQYRGFAKHVGHQGRSWKRLRYLTQAAFYDWEHVPSYLNKQIRHFMAFFSSSI